MPEAPEPRDSSFSEQICYASLEVSSYAKDVHAHSILSAETKQGSCHVLSMLGYLDSFQ